MLGSCKDRCKDIDQFVFWLFLFAFCTFVERHMRDCAMFSVRPKNRHSLHYSTIKFYNDGQVTCDWHSGRKICEHKILWGEALGLSLTYLRGLRQAAIDSYYESALNQFIIKPISTRRIPLHPNFR